MKLINKYTSDDYDLANGSMLNVNANHDNDVVKVSPKSNKQGEAKIQERILDVVEVNCSKWDDEIRIDLSKYETIPSLTPYIDSSDENVTIITLEGDGRHKLTIKIVNNV
tara:strand:- start:414 stop:743 length:330 start_codon:yes stop_codon:yes gene_type:complete